MDEASVFTLPDTLRDAECLKKLTSLSVFFCFKLHTRATSTVAKMTTVAQMFYLMFSSLKSKWERKSDTEGERPRENRENKRQ